jgi:ATP-dependent helicase/nuclease subunit A
MSGAGERALRADAEARRLAHTEFGRPLVVEAGAGTGKTALLTARVVAWCLGPGWQLHAGAGADNAAVARKVIEGVVAITFTEAAASEMAQRVAEALSLLARGIDPPAGVDSNLLSVAAEERTVRAAALADEVHRLAAQTIHSWCHRLLGTFPLEADLHPGFEVDGDGSRTETLVEEVVVEALRELSGGELNADWRVLAAAGVVPPSLADALHQLVASGVSADELLIDPFETGAVEPLVTSLRDVLDAFFSAEAGTLSDLKGSKTSARTMSALAQVSRGLRQCRAANPIRQLVETVQAMGAAELDRLRKWARADFNATERNALGESAATVAAAAAPLAPLITGVTEMAVDEFGAARRVLASLLHDVRSRMRVQGVVTFDDLLRATKKLVETSDRVRRELRLAIDQLMVDEFQDTDSTQCEIVRWLALDGPTGERPGLFIVGDPKQSIYGWRRADLAAYDAFKALVRSEGGLVQPLVRNFRSVQPILDEVERLVGPVMEEEEGLQPAFQPLEATDERRSDPGFDISDWCALEHWVVWPADPDTGEPDPKATVAPVDDLEAVTLATDIRRLHDEAGVAWGNIALLLRTTTQQEIILDRFRAIGIPFEVAREREYYRQREVVEAAALVRCVLEPGDSLALLTVLRSDALGVPDAALVPLWDAGFPSLMADLSQPNHEDLRAIDACIERAQGATPANLPGSDDVPNWPLLLRAAAETVAVLRLSVRSDPPDRFVERMRTLWLAEVTASARYLGRYRRARLERFFDQLGEALGATDGSLAPIARFLRRAVEEGRESLLPAEPDITTDAVHVMTIHGAKGLDFDHVYLAQIHRGEGSGARRPNAEVWRSVDGFEYRLFGWPTPGFAEVEARRKDRERAERVRLLYVAMTRAKARLVLTGRWSDRGELITAARATSFADLVAHRVDRKRLEGQVTDRRHRATELAQPVQWVLPAFGNGTVDSEVPMGKATELQPRRVLEDAARLHEARAVAALRSALPYTARVSELAHRRLELDPDGRLSPDPLVREAGFAVGSVVHHLMETLDLEQDLGPQLSDRVQDMESELASRMPADGLDSAVQRLHQVLDRIENGNCLRRLGSLADRVLARELPLLLPPGDDAVGAIVGTADLVYRDNDRLVVADYKTDAVVGEAEFQQRADVYRPQLELYARALTEALDLSEPPVMELWFLHADRIVRL